MSSKPKIDIIGSCVSRDVFNSRFTDGYRDLVEVGETVYQTALPSLVEYESISNVDETHGVKEIFTKTLNEEYSGDNLHRLIGSRPDFIVFDFFADIHMGITRRMGRYVTRNHMAFQTLHAADRYFDDQDASSSQRMRFGDSGYSLFAIEALRAISDRLKSDLPKTELIVNSARFSTMHTDGVDTLHEFNNAKRLEGKNQRWSSLDKIATSELNAHRISHDDSLFVASSTHPWGLHPVHYTQPYYDDLWRKIREITEV